MKWEAKRRLVGRFGVVAAAVVAAAGWSATTPSAAESSVPEIPPLVFETEIVRTSAPLSLFNTLPPPVPLSQLPELPATAMTSGPVVAPPDRMTSPTPTARRSPRPTPAQVIPTEAAADWRIYRKDDRPSPPRPVDPRSYTDSLVLTNGRTLKCRVLDEKSTSLRVELANGVSVEFPKDRLAKIIRKASSP